MLINNLSNEEIKLFEPLMARNLIETLLHSWKDYKNNKKHERKQMSLENVVIHILGLVLKNNQVVVNHPNAYYLSYTIPHTQMSLLFKLYCT